MGVRVFQVGAGSGGIAVLDLLARDERISHITLVEPDVYQSHNVYRHFFPQSAVGRGKAELTKEWLKGIRPELPVEILPVDLTDPANAKPIHVAVELCDLGVCAVDNEVAKYAFDAVMRQHRKPWTLGEVLSGGIGGWLHSFHVDGPCYGCVASHLQRSGPADRPAGPPPNYADATGPIAETTIPASKASIAAIASWHALRTLDLLASPAEFSSMLVTLAKVPGVFEEAFRIHRFGIPKSLECLLCSSIPISATGEELDVALDLALNRLGHE
jgi:molybdopterin/thiamine biosynthesis adenylyltransferase